MSRPVPSQVTILPARPGIHEVGPDRYFVDASDLGLNPGEWPNLLTVEGSGQLWSFESVEKREGDIIGVTYRSGRNTLQVFND